MMMPRPSPVRLLLILLGLVVVGGLGVMLWQQQGQISVQRRTIAALNGRLTQAQGDAETLQGQLTQLDAERRTLTERLAASQKDVEQTRDGLRAVQSQLVDASSRAGALQQEKEALADQLAAATKERDSTKQQLTQLRSQKAQADSRQEELQQRVTSLTGEIDRLKQQGAARETAAVRASPANGAIQLPSIVVRAGATAGAVNERTEPARPARVLEVNVPYRFVVLDQGSDDGVLPAMVFDVQRGATTVGRVIAKKIRTHLTACDLDSSSASSSFQVGDVAVPRRN